MARSKKTTLADPRAVDDILATGSSVRCRILKMCSTQTIRAASRLSDDWFEGASNKETWRARMSRHPILASCDPTFDFPTPAMYSMVLALPPSHLHTLQCMTKGNVEEFFPNLGLLTGFPHGVYNVQFPALHVLLRIPEVLQLPPSDHPPKEGYALFAPWVMIITAVLRWYKVLGCPGQMVPWLLSVYQWPASSHLLNGQSFHKIMLAAAMAILTPTAGVPSNLGDGTTKVHTLPPLPTDLVDRLLEITHLVAGRFMKPNFESSYLPDPTLPSAPSPSDPTPPLEDTAGNNGVKRYGSATPVCDGDLVVGASEKHLSYVEGRKMKRGDGSDGTMQVLLALLQHSKKKEDTDVRPAKTRAFEARTNRVNALRQLGLLPSTAQVIPPNENVTAALAREAKIKDIRDAAVRFVADAIQAGHGMTSAQLRLLGDTDPRMIVSVYYHIVRRNPERRDEVLGHLVERWGISGLEEYISASRRVEYLVQLQADLHGIIHHSARE